MNRRQEERVADLGRAFHEAVSDIINMEEPTQIEEPALEVCERIEAYEREEVCRPMPVVDMNDKLAQYDVINYKLQGHLFLLLTLMLFL